MNVTRRLLWGAVLILGLFEALNGQVGGKKISPNQVVTDGTKTYDASQGKSGGHILRRPGEITFTVGAVIEGKIEKPQVVIVFPKEKPKRDTLVFDKSFKREMLQPLEVKAVKAIER